MPLDFGTKSDAYLERLRQNYCRKCKLSFVCLMGRVYRDSFWCQKCKGWWLSEHDIFVRCDGFPGTRHGQFERRRSGGKHFVFNDGQRMRPVSAMHDGKTTIDACPLCDPQGENPLDIIEGLVEEHEP